MGKKFWLWNGHSLCRITVLSETAKQYKVEGGYRTVVNKADINRQGFDGSIISDDPDIIAKALDNIVERERRSLERLKSRVANAKRMMKGLGDE